jgi:phytoene synthase
MSDTVNSPILASANDFDSRLKRTDEGRWLATRYADEAGRQRLVAIYLLDQQLRRTLQAKDPMLGKIRLQWWREMLEQTATTNHAPRHDLAQELARVMNGRPDLLLPLAAWVDTLDAVLDDHLHASGHSVSEEHERRHLAVEGALMRLAAHALVRDPPETVLSAMEEVAVAALVRKAALEDAEARWALAVRRARSVPPRLWPAILHLALDDASPTETQPTPLGKRWVVFKTMITRRL